MSYINNIKIARLEHTNASTYGGPFLASSVTGINGIFTDLNVYGTISANSLFFTSTTAIELTVTGEELNFLGSLSITGDAVPPIKDYLLTVFDNTGINKFTVTTGGYVGINNITPNVELQIEGGQTINGTSGSNFIMQNALDQALKFDTTFSKYEFFNLNNNLIALGIYPNDANVLSITGATVISSSATIGGPVGINTPSPLADLHVDGNVIFDASSGTQFKLQNQTDSLVKFDTANEVYEFIEWGTLYKRLGIYPAGANILSVTGAIKISSSASLGGPVGINNIEPRADLHVDGNIIFDASSGSIFKLQNATDTLVNFDAANEVYEFNNWGSGNLKLGIYPNKATILSITGSAFLSSSAIIMGNVGINILEPEVGLHVLDKDVIFDGASGIQLSLQKERDSLVKFDTANEKYTFYDWSSGNLKLAIYPNQDEVLSVSGNVNVTGDLNVNGFKNFRIDHPNPEKNETHYLVHSALEGPEAGIYYRINVKAKRFTSKIKINFPDYWKFLVEDNKTQIFLSSNGYRLNEYIKNIYLNEYFIIKKRFFQKTDLNCIIFSSRKSEKEFKSEILK